MSSGEKIKEVTDKMGVSTNKSAELIDFKGESVSSQEDKTQQDKEIIKINRF